MSNFAGKVHGALGWDEGGGNGGKYRIWVVCCGGYFCWGCG